MLDNTIDKEIPEGLKLPIHPAGPVVRFYAWLLDQMIRGVIYLILLVTLSSLRELGIGIALILVFTLEWFYPVLFETLHDGATPGKRLLGLRVVRDDLEPIDWQSSILRNLLRGIDFLPMFYLFGLIATLMNPGFKRLGDLAAGSLVIHDLPTGKLPSLNTPPTPARWPLEPAEQQAIVEFTHRRSDMTDARADELARLTGPLVDASRTPADQLSAIASWITGAAPK